MYIYLSPSPTAIVKSPGSEAKGRVQHTQSNRRKEKEERQALRARTRVAMKNEDEDREATGEEEGPESSPPA